MWRFYCAEKQMQRRLALFDLDNTLLGGDSDHAWGEFLISKEFVDAESHRDRNDQFYRQYRKGTLDIHDYVRFTLGPILHSNQEELRALHDEFMDQFISPMMLKKAENLVEQHRRANDICVIITATNEYITAPIANLFSVDALIATELEVENGHYTGNITGTPCFQAGKVDKLKQWLALQEEDFRLEAGCFYSDSINDLPLLNLVEKPVAVDPDPQLLEVAESKGWELISLR
jgi:HAD superfamily hydrolase (TIGR01490 family)